MGPQRDASGRLAGTSRLPAGERAQLWKTVWLGVPMAGFTTRTHRRMSS